MKSIGIFGSTGSIGQSTLEIVRKNPGLFHISCLAANRNAALLAAQAMEFKPGCILITDEHQLPHLKELIGNEPVRILSGLSGLKQMAQEADFDMMVSAMVGAAGLEPTVACITRGKDIALANKETLVAGGALVTRLVREHQVSMIPVDSEHSAIFQCLVGERPETIGRIILTASGGPFRGWSREQLRTITPEQALKHPNWSMGQKITIDSATLMNKGLEVIEAHWLFNLPPEYIDVVIHPQSIIHSMVEFRDGSVKAQMGLPDMKLPIQYALTYPERQASDFPRLDFRTLQRLDFAMPDSDNFPCLKLAYQALAAGGTLPAALNAANEIAVEYFLKKMIPFMAIPEVIDAVMQHHRIAYDPRLEDILEADRSAREFALKHIKAITV